MVQKFHNVDIDSPVSDTSGTKSTRASDFPVNKKFKFTFIIQKVLFSESKERNGFTIVSAIIKKNNKKILFDMLESDVIGTIVNPKVGDTYDGTGFLKKTERFGIQVVLSQQPELVLPKSKSEIISYIQNNIEGLGKVRATKIYDIFKGNTFEVLGKTPERLLKTEGLSITAGIVDKIKESFSDSYIISDVFKVLDALSLPTKYAFDIYTKYGRDSVEITSGNPYVITEFNKLLFTKADYSFLEQLNNTSMVNPETIQAMLKGTKRYQAAVKFYLRKELDETGSLAVFEKDLLRSFSEGEFLDKYGVKQGDGSSNRPSNEIIKSLLSKMEEGGSIVITTDKNGDNVVYDEASWASENKLILNIKNFNSKYVDVIGKETRDLFIAEFEKENNIKMAKRQRDSVDLLVNYKISILTGGPGTGKTSTLKSIKSYIDWLSKTGRLPHDTSIALLAPTGKASMRMSEVLGVEAMTIHRKLGLKGFGRDEEPSKIEEDFVIVDESSMIDIHLFSVLLESLSHNSHLLIVGDANQLPSVGPGLVLRDLIESGKVKTIILNKVFRQGDGSLIAENALKMNSGIGTTNDEYGLKFQSNTKTNIENKTLLDSYFIECPSESIVDTTKLLFTKLRDFYGINVEEDVLILSSQKKGISGTYNINKEIQSITRKSESIEDGVIRKIDNSVFFIGDPVIQLVNDYDNDVFNGEIGHVADINKAEKIVYVDFGNEELIEYKNAGLSEINLAYAITYHKSQGSEAKVVIQIVDESQERMLHRSLVYTGYTRTRQTNFIIGQKNALNTALQNTSDLNRFSLIKERL